MKFPQPHTLKQIASIINAEFVGADDFPISGMNEIHVVTSGDIVFVDHPKYYDQALHSKASVVLINKRVACPEGKALLISEDPFRDFNALTDYFRPFEKAKKKLAATAEVGEGTLIQPGVFIGNHVKIGKNCLIHPQVALLDHTRIGDDVIIQANTVVGSDAFYYKNRPEGYDRLKSGGGVVIEDRVEIGAGCTIDRGVSGDTTIKEGTKLDNQVHVGHDTVIGRNCLVASQCGIAGCVIMEDGVTLWGQVGVKNGIILGEKAEVLAKTGVSKSLPGGKVYFGAPAEEARKYFRKAAAVRQVPELLKRVEKLEKA